jgi:hypothetical protein
MSSKPPMNNAETRAWLERVTETEAGIDHWITEHQGDDPKPVTWRWEDSDGLRDSMEDVDVEYADGSHKLLNASEVMA